MGVLEEIEKYYGGQVNSFKICLEMEILLELRLQRFLCVSSIFYVVHTVGELFCAIIQHRKNHGIQ